MVTDVGSNDRSIDREHRSDVEDDEPVDHKPEVEEKSMPKCEKFVAAYEACAERIQGDETGEAHCTVSTNTKPRGRVASERVRRIERMNACANERLTGVISLFNALCRVNILTCGRALTSAQRRKSWRAPFERR